ncbi:MAG TPA: helix-turn-helix transcriptional regulator [Verrucomicrobiae bacterium]
MSAVKKIKGRSNWRDAAIAARPSFAEAPAWKTIGNGWRPLFGSHHDLGFSFEWHEFTALQEFDWARSFHPGSVELCLNLAGTGKLSDGQQSIELLPQTLAFYFQGAPPLMATRPAGVEHRFITIEFSPAFLVEHFRGHVDNVHPLVRDLVRGRAVDSVVAPPERLAITLQQLVESLRHCPVFNPAQEMWFRSKALEVAAHLFFRPANGELLCTRTQRLARERVEKAKLILKERMQEPPSLEELARMSGCSPFYLSRQFAQSGGLTMQQYLRQIRMERAAELLRTGKCNVTEAAFEVGYNSLSHFSSTFHETFGCCPGLYPLRTGTQQATPSDGGRS